MRRILPRLAGALLAAGLLWARPALSQHPAEVCFRVPCGDVNADGSTDLSDAIYLLDRLFRGGPAAACSGLPGDPGLCCSDVNGDARLDISDPVYLLRWKFTGGAPLVCLGGCELRIKVLLDGTPATTADSSSQQAIVSVYEIESGTLLDPALTNTEGIATLPCVEPPFALTAQLDLEVGESGGKVARLASTVLVDHRPEGALGILLPEPELDSPAPDPSSTIAGSVSGIPALAPGEVLHVEAEIIGNFDAGPIPATLTPTGPSSSDFVIPVGAGRYQVWASIDDGAPGEDRHYRLAALYPEVVPSPGAPEVRLDFDDPDQRVLFAATRVPLAGALGKDGDWAYIGVQSVVSSDSGLRFELSGFRHSERWNPFPSCIPGVPMVDSAAASWDVRREVFIEYDEEVRRSQDALLLPEDTRCPGPVELAPIVDGEVTVDPRRGVCVDLEGPDTDGFVRIEIEGPGGVLEGAAPGDPARETDGVFWSVLPDQSARTAADFCLPPTPLPMFQSGREYTLDIESIRIAGSPPIGWEDLRAFDLDSDLLHAAARRSALDSDRIIRFTYCDTAGSCGRRLRVFFSGSGFEPMDVANDTDRQAIVSVYEYDSDTLFCPVLTNADGIATLPCAEPPFAVTAQRDRIVWEDGVSSLFRVAGTLFVDESIDGDLGIVLPGGWPQLEVPDPPLEIRGTISRIPTLLPGESLVVRAEYAPDGERRETSVPVAPGASSAGFAVTVGPGKYKLWALIEDGAWVPRLGAFFPGVVELTGAPQTVGLSFAAGGGQRVEFGPECLHLHGVLAAGATSITLEDEITGPAGQLFWVFVYGDRAPPGGVPALPPALPVVTRIPSGFSLHHELVIRYVDSKGRSLVQYGDWTPPDHSCGSAESLDPIPQGDVVSDPSRPGARCVELSGPGRGELLTARILGRVRGASPLWSDALGRTVDEVHWVFYPRSGEDGRAIFCLPRTVLAMLADGFEYELLIQTGRIGGEPPVDPLSGYLFDVGTVVEGWEARTGVTSELRLPFPN